MKYDLIIIGLGPAGQKLALEANKRNKKVLVFEKNKAGGTCLNVGCIPTKAILNDIKTSSWEECIIRKNNIVSKFNSAIEKDFEKRGIQIIKGEATLDYLNKKVIYKNQEYCADKIVIATGSEPFEIKGLEFDHQNILSSDDIFNLEKLPKSIAIIGSGAIGIEWTRILNSKGIETFVIEAKEHLLPQMDIDISKRIERIFKINKIKYFTNTVAMSFKNGILELSTGETINVEKVLVAVGRKKLFPKCLQEDILKINDDFTTNYKDIYSIGDTTNYPMLAHSATHQAEMLALNLYENKNIKTDFLIPSVIYGEPEIASVGIKEQDINKENYEIYNMPILALPKAWCDNQTEGFIKIIAKDNLIKGAHIISKEASSLLTSVMVAIENNVTIDNFRKIIFPHPTLSEGLSQVFDFKK